MFAVDFLTTLEGPEPLVSDRTGFLTDLFHSID